MLWQIRDHSDLWASYRQVPTISDLLYVLHVSSHKAIMSHHVKPWYWWIKLPYLSRLHSDHHQTTAAPSSHPKEISSTFKSSSAVYSPMIANPFHRPPLCWFVLFARIIQPQIPVTVPVAYGSEPGQNPEWDPKFRQSGLSSGRLFFNLKATQLKLS
jgi:hypothetical protein